MTTVDTSTTAYAPLCEYRSWRRCGCCVWRDVGRRMWHTYTCGRHFCDQPYHS